MLNWLIGVRGVVFGLVILALDIWAIRKTFAADVTPAKQLAWSAVIVLLPGLGLVIWALAGPKVPKPAIYDHEPP